MSEYRLDELCEILDSKRVPLSAMQREKRQGPYPYYGAQNIIDYVDDYLLDGEYLLVAEDGANLVTRTQDIANFVSGKIWVNNHAHILGYNGKCPLQLLGFILNNLNISPYVTGCAQPKLNQDNLRRITIRLPENVDEVSSILSSLDDKIECNRKICANLEAQAQALFKHWFIDFAPFKNGKFVESELGMIPEGWRVGTLGEIISTNKRSYKGDFANTIHYLDTGSITNNVIDTIQVLDPKVDKIPSRAKRAVTEGDIVFSSVRPNQKHYGFLFNPIPELVVSTGFIVITANWSGYRYFVYRYLTQDSVIKKLQAIAEQSVSTFPSINATDVEKLKVVIPPNDIVGEFAMINCKMMFQIDVLQQESSRLSALRDTLLPKLMSGEIKV